MPIFQQDVAPCKSWAEEACHRYLPISCKLPLGGGSGARGAPVPVRGIRRSHREDSEGYPSRSKDEETRVRTCKSKFQPWLGRGAGTGAFCASTLKPKDFIWLLKSDCTEPTTLRLTAE